MKVEATPVLTFTGMKTRYKLLDMAYGEWLVYKNGQPLYYINIFDKTYEDLNTKINGNIEDYLKNRLRSNHPYLSLNPNIFGLNIGRFRDVDIIVEKLPLHFLE